MIHPQIGEQMADFACGTGGFLISWLKELGNPYALSLFDGDGMLGLDLGVYGAPETFLIDGNGIIRYRHAGDLNPRVWEEEIKPLWEKYSKEAAQ